MSRAAEIINYDIRSRNYNCEVLPALSTVADRNSLFPESLNLFMDELVLKDKKATNYLRHERKIFAIGEAVTSLIRERSYVSPLLTNLGIHLHRSYDSKHLNKISEVCGFC